MLTVNFPPEVESQVLRNASERGQDTEQYLYQLIDMALRQPVPPIIPAKTSKEDFLQRWGARAAHHQSQQVPTDATLHEPTYRREDIYDDEGR